LANQDNRTAFKRTPNLNIKDNLPSFKTISSIWVGSIANFQGYRTAYFVGKALTLVEQKKNIFLKDRRLQTSANFRQWLHLQSHVLFTYRVFLEP